MLMYSQICGAHQLGQRSDLQPNPLILTGPLILSSGTEKDVNDDDTVDLARLILRDGNSCYRFYHIRVPNIGLIYRIIDFGEVAPIGHQKLPQNSACIYPINNMLKLKMKTQTEEPTGYYFYKQSQILHCSRLEDKQHWLCHAAAYSCINDFQFSLDTPADTWSYKKPGLSLPDKIYNRCVLDPVQVWNLFFKTKRTIKR